MDQNNYNQNVNQPNGLPVAPEDGQTMSELGIIFSAFTIVLAIALVISTNVVPATDVETRKQLATFFLLCAVGIGTTCIGAVALFVCSILKLKSFKKEFPNEKVSKSRNINNIISIVGIFVEIGAVIGVLIYYLF